MGRCMKQRPVNDAARSAALVLVILILSLVILLILAVLLIFVLAVLLILVLALILVLILVLILHVEAHLSSADSIPQEQCNIREMFAFLKKRYQNFHSCGTITKKKQERGGCYEMSILCPSRQ